MTTDTAERQLLGLPITGSFTPSSRSSVEQWDEVKFKELLDEIFAIAPAVSPVFYGYTPYFNDGDECTYRLDLRGVLLEGAVADEETAWDAEGNWEDIPAVSLYDMYDYPHGYPAGKVVKPEYEAIFPRLEKLSKAMAHFEVIFLKHFGDHAKILAQPTGFTVEFYEHD